MTALDTRTDVPVRLDVDTLAPAFVRAITHLDTVTARELERTGVDARLAHLLRLRASQLNGCAYCVDMHTKDLRAAGEDDERVAALPVWAETGFFSPAERAALAWTESVTLCAQTRVPVEVHDELAAHFSPEQVGALLALVVSINAWNAVGVAARPWQPGSYQP